MTSDASTHLLDHVTIAPKILYFGTPVVLLSTENEDATSNLAPISSAWALGRVVVLGLGVEGQSARNLSTRPDMVINFPSPGQWEAVERLAPLTGRRRGRVESEVFGVACSWVAADLSASWRGCWSSSWGSSGYRTRSRSWARRRCSRTSLSCRPDEAPARQFGGSDRMRGRPTRRARTPRPPR